MEISSISRLEGVHTQLISLLPPASGIRCSTVDHLLAIFRPNKTATVYINEIIFSLLLQAKRDVKAGEPISYDDIVDIQRMVFKDVHIPKECGFLFLFSVGWRKGLYYNFSPFHPDHNHARDYDVEVCCGQYYAYLSFQHLFKITEEDWKNMFYHQWFPFISLSNKVTKDIVNHARNGWVIDDLLPEISNELSAKLDSISRKWKNNPFFQPHLPLLRRAAERYSAGDHISVTSILYPRIEGIMRTYHLTVKRDTNLSQGRIVTSVIEAVRDKRHARSLLLPNNFRRYLSEIYFASFAPQDPTMVSRHTVSHGTASADDYSLKSATIAFLVIEQLSYYLTVNGPN